MLTLTKQIASQRFILKIHSERLRKAKWRLTLPLEEARRNDEIVSLSDSQLLRWIDELNGCSDADTRAAELRREIRRVRREAATTYSKRKIRRLYSELDEVQFKPDYLCVIMDRTKDYVRACNGFTVNGIRYVRLLGTNGGVKTSTIVFVSERLAPELRKRIENGRAPDKPLVPAKLEAYKSLVCSGSSTVSMPRGVIVVNDCETEFYDDIIYLNDEMPGEPTMEGRKHEKIVLDESDGYGIVLPSLAERWAGELRLDYRPSAFNTRFSFEKGVVFCFDFREFAEKIAGSYIVKDAWGVERDVRDAELILTTSMLKLWDSYESLESYLCNCEQNHYTFSVTKTSPKELEHERSLNYQFIQSYDLSDDDVEELIAPTMNEMKDILSADYRKTILFLCGGDVGKGEMPQVPDGFVRAIMAEPEMIRDPYIQSRIYYLIRKRIADAKIGVLSVHGNYSIISGDPYALCQSIFGLKVTGLLRAGEIYNKYWLDAGAEQLACFRAPMSCGNNIKIVNVCKSEEAAYWYRYMTTVTALNCWDTITHALNGADKDGDIVMLTDNRILVSKAKRLPTLMCIQRKAEKIIPRDEDFVRANINSFGNDIGRITNFVTSMYDVRTRFPEGSREREILDYRIMCGQLFQQNAIDKAKGIIAKPMPKEWYDRHAALSMEDEQMREMYLSILADKKPYFMCYIYPDLMKEYKEYKKAADKKARRDFRKTADELFAQSPDTLSENERDFLLYYERCLPVSDGDCVTNRVCRRFEQEFDGYIGKHAVDRDFDYRIMKSDAAYTERQYSAVSSLLDDFNRRTQDIMSRRKKQRIDEHDAAAQFTRLQDTFRIFCDLECPNSKALCNIILDLCYHKRKTMAFAWNVCSAEIVDNLLERNGGMISYPVEDCNGDVLYGGRAYTFRQKKLEDLSEYRFE